MDFRQEIEKKLKNILKKDVVLEVPPNPEMGDFAFPCFPLAKELKKAPVVIAQDIVKQLKKIDGIEKIEAKGPYVNFFVDATALAKETIKRIQKEKDAYGSEKYAKEKVMVEFSQANTHKAFHVGHIKGTSLGESVARILEFCGNDVKRVNYQGDTGMHVAKWLWCYKKYHKKTPLKEDEAWIASIYVDAVKRLTENPDLQEEVNEINRKLDSGEDKELTELWKKTRKLSLDSFEIIYKEMNTHFDQYFFESQVEQRAKEIAKELVKKGIAKIDDGATIINMEEYNLGVWVLLRKDGTALYSAKDLALAEKKFEEHKIDRAVYVVGNEQRMHVHQIFKTLELMKFKQAKNCQYVPIMEVRFPEGKMSSRTGNNILYSDFKKDLVEHASQEITKREKLDKKELEKRALAIAIASMKYTMLKQDTNKNIIFDKNEALRFEGDTGPYLLYSYARARSILRKANKNVKKYEIETIEASEKKLLSELNKFSKVVHQAYLNLAPNLIANYANTLAQTFNEFYHANQVIGSKEEDFRLMLVESFSQVLKNALYLLGIHVIEEM